jgi:hypothetical protein
MLFRNEFPKIAYLPIGVSGHAQVQGLISVFRATTIVLMALRSAKQPHGLLVNYLQCPLSTTVNIY